MVLKCQHFLLIITEVRCGFTCILIFSKCKYLHAEIASLATVKSCVTIVPFRDGKCLAQYSLHRLPHRLSALTEDTSMTTVSRCGFKLQ